MFHVDAAAKTFTTSDGATLATLEAGSGTPLIMIPGWSQTARQWHHQINHFQKTHRVIAMDMRGHGASQKVTHGFRVTRFARDVRELMEAYDLTDAVLMGHSMGCSVIWAYYDAYGADRLSKLVLCDQSPSLSNNDALTEAEKADAGALFTPAATYETASALAGDADGTVTTGFVGGMFTKAADRDLVAAVIEANLELPRREAATLLIDHVGMDWRDVIARISIPVLAVGGTASLVPHHAVRWTAATTGGRAEIFEEGEGGAHFMFMENPEKYNRIVGEFLSDA
ncbi:MAG: alpha/beta hydrolase [Pseudomonadota bacterium]